MSDLLQTADRLLPLLKYGALVCLVLAALTGIAIATYIVRTSCSPMLTIVQWLLWHKPGERLHPILAGVSHGLRLVIWSVFVGVGFWILFQTFGGSIMSSLERIRHDNERSVFAASSIATVVGGIILAGLAFYLLKPAKASAPVALPPVVIEKKIRVEVPGPERTVYKEPVGPVYSPPPVPPPSLEVVGEWTGVWKLPNGTLPMFQIRQVGSNYSGWCAANWSGNYPIKDGKLREDNLEFSVSDDKFCRLQFRMVPLQEGRARVLSWVKPEDAFVMLSSAIRAAKTRQEAIYLRLNLEANIARLGKPKNLGVFVCVVDPGKLTGEAAKGNSKLHGGQSKSFSNQKGG